MGFFYSDEEAAKAGVKKSGPRESKPKQSHLDQAAAMGCAACPLNKAKLTTPKMEPAGSEKPLVYVLGDAPGKEDDEAGVHFSGKSGRSARVLFPKDLEKSVRFNNVIRCRTPGGRKPAPVELACCAQKQIEDIERTKPKVILGFGHSALKFGLGPVGLLDPWRGRKVAVRIGNHACWYVPAEDPHKVLLGMKRREGKEDKAAFDRDVRSAFVVAQGEDPAPEDLNNLEEGFRYLLTYKEIDKALDGATKWGEGAIDIETNCMRPYAKTKRILTVALSNFDETLVFPISHSESSLTPEQQTKVHEKLHKVLLKWDKVWAHNSKFEMEWLAAYGGDKMLFDVPWQDTMAQAYSIDEREGAKDLGSCTLLYFGFDLKKQSDVRVAQLDREPLKKVLRYNGMDAKYTYALQVVQTEVLADQKLEEVYELQNRRAPALVKAQMKGLVPNQKALLEFHQKLDKESVDILAKILGNKDVKQYVKEGREFNPAAPQQMADFFYHHLGFKEINSAKEGEPEKLSSDEKTLEKIDHPVATNLVDLRGKSRLHTFYVVPLLKQGTMVRRELQDKVGKNLHDDGLVHTSFNHLRTSTGRLSSEDPNVQNFPKKEAKEIRNGIKAPPGFKIVSIDYGQIEARVLGMLSRDPFLMNALWEKYDIHMVWAEKIANSFPRKLGEYVEKAKSEDEEKLLKAFRQDVKNMWTFPLFYGAGLPNVSKALELPEPKLAPLYDEFWDTFKGVKQWQEDTRDRYRKDFFVETITGRRRHGPMSINEMINSPIQGSASDVVVEAMVRLAEIAYRTGLGQYAPVMNIHDDLTFYLEEDHLEEDILFIAEEMCKPALPWIVCPLEVEISVGDTWGAQEEVAKFNSADFGMQRPSKPIAKRRVPA